MRCLAWLPVAFIKKIAAILLPIGYGDGLLSGAFLVDIPAEEAAKLECASRAS